MKLKLFAKKEKIHSVYKPIMQLKKYISCFDHLPFVLVHVPKNGGTSILQSSGVQSGRIHATAWEMRVVAGELLAEKELIAVYRDPVSRFTSAFLYYLNGGNGRKNDISIQKSILEYPCIDSFIKCGGIRKLSLQNRAFWPQSNYILDPFGNLIVDHLFHINKLEESFDKYIAGKNIKTKEFETHNKALRDKPSLSAESVEILKDVYKSDYILTSERDI